MEAILREDIMQSMAETFLQEFASIFDKLDSQLQKSFQDNSQRRWNLQKRLEKYDEQWKRQSRKLAACIQDVHEDPKEENEKTHSDITTEENSLQIPEEDASPSKDSQASADEPDWDSLLDQDHAPTVARVRRFLEARDRLQAAEDKFRHSLGDILGKIAATTDDLLQIADDVYTPLDGALGSEESELQYYLVQNFQRRHVLVKAVEESAEQKQSFFARLLALIRGKRKREADASA